MHFLRTRVVVGRLVGIVAPGVGRPMVVRARTWQGWRRVVRGPRDAQRLRAAEAAVAAARELPGHRDLLARALTVRAIRRNGLDRLTEALADCAEAEAILRGSAAGFGSVSGDREWLGRVLGVRGDTLARLDRDSEALAVLTEAVAVLRDQVRIGNRRALVPYAQQCWQHGRALLAADRLVQADEAFAEVAAVWRRERPTRRLRHLQAYGPALAFRASTLLRLDRDDEAATMAREAEDRLEALCLFFPDLYGRTLAFARTARASALHRLGDRDGAIVAVDRAIRGLRRLAVKGHGDEASLAWALEVRDAVQRDSGS